MNRRHVMIASVILTANSAAAVGQSASELTMNDYNASYQMILRLQPIGDELAHFITHPPFEGSNLAQSVQTQDCMISLVGTFENFQDRFSEISNLVGLSTKMKDAEDKEWVIKSLSIKLSGFLTNVPLWLRMIDITAQTSKCSQDGATLAKTPEIKRAFADVQRLVQSFSDRIGTKALQRR
jgi:hypothetical protein